MMASEDLQRFVGTWENVKDEGFNEFLIEMGIGLIKRKIVTKIKPTITISVDGDSVTFKRKGTGPFKDHSDTYKLDAEEKHTTPDGNEIKQITSLKDGKLISENKPLDNNYKPNIVERELINDNEMVMTMTVNNVSAKRHFKKVIQ